MERSLTTVGDQCVPDGHVYLGEIKVLQAE
jgi:hypothetical protein